MNVHRTINVAGWISVSITALLVALTAVAPRSLVHGETQISGMAEFHTLSAANSTESHVRVSDYLDLPEVQQPGSVGHGALLLRHPNSGAYYQAPDIATKVDIKITGMVARVTVKQQFTNPTTDWLNGIYVFPLPEQASVDGMRLLIGQRVIQGEIKKRAEAKRIYEAARTMGQKASLVEQERPNLFTTSLANMGPGESVSVEIHYQQTLSYDKDRFSIRFPMVITPRYIPGQQNIEGFAGNGWAGNTNEVPDAARITPPHKEMTGNAGTDNPVTIDINLQAGLPLTELRSPYHSIITRDLGGDRYQIRLDETSTPANRDFELFWTPRKGEAPKAAFFTEPAGELDSEIYGLLMLMPQHDDIGPAAVISREMIYVVDTSGSMQGESIIQARQALLYSLDQLKKTDTFNIIQFNSTPHSMSSHALAATLSNITVAKDYVNSLSANGGTEVAMALDLVLDGGSLKHSESRAGLRQIVLMTDGSVGNESDLFKMIDARLADSRLFTVGIGAAPNSHFMREAAALGRGSFTYIGKTSYIHEKMTELFAKMQSPVLADIHFEWQDAALSPEIWPNPLPDLYLGEPVIVSLKIPPGLKSLKLSGRQAGKGWSAELPVVGGGTADGLGKLWASHKIQSLTSKQRLSSTPSEYKDAITALALEHGLVSKYTSFVAVETEPSKPPGIANRDAPVKLLTPQGSSGQAVPGTLAQTATPAQLHLVTGLLLLLLALAGWWHQQLCPKQRCSRA